jgi:L,D-peptidoglycan transpeptidase YkuD (ErfK/YbiS/YcfS/YnhG family)
VIQRLVLAAALVATTLLAPASSATAPAAAANWIRLDGVTVKLRPATRQVVTVNHTRGTYARVVLWRRLDGTWREVARTTGRTGYGGLVPGGDRRQGTGTTPLGTFKLLSSFGTHARSRNWGLAHRRIRSGDYWVQDNRSRYYNRYRNKAQGGFRWRLPSSDYNSSERLSDYGRQYEFSLVTGFNYADQVRHRGSGIFLHVNGRGATAGCVSTPRRFMVKLMNRLEPRLVPLIAIGR